MNWRDHLAKKIIVEEYYIVVNMSGIGKVQFKIRYVTHNGYTVIEPLPEYNHKITDFEEWFKLRIDFNTRYDQPHYWRRIRGTRDKKLTLWALGTIQKAFNQYTQENIKGKENYGEKIN